MRRLFAKWLMVGYLGLSAGCQFGRPKPYANDPLLRIRNPVLGTATSAEVRMPLPPDDPEPPPIPPSAIERSRIAMAGLPVGS